MTAERLGNFTFVPPHTATVGLRIDPTGIFYNDTKLEEKYIVLKTNLEQNARGISLAVTNQDHWIDIVALALKKQIKLTSLTHDGYAEPWFQWNEAGHKHDAQGAALRVVNETNRVMIERGITHLVIDTSAYTGSEAYEFKVIQEQIPETEFWVHYRCLQTLTGVLAYGYQSVQPFDVNRLMTHVGIAVVLGFSLLEKVDFFKDISVAWSYPHSSATHAFLLWFSISLPVFSVLFYFVYIGEWYNFLPSFFGYAEVMAGSE